VENYPPKKGESNKKVVTINGKKVTYCRKKQEEQKKGGEPKTEPKKPTKDAQGLALRVMNTILASDSEHDSNGSEQESE
jgi:hypothetical protein